jgi:hypothetical protein
MTDWSQIVQQHGPGVWQTLHRLLTNDADEADCFQRTFVSARLNASGDVTDSHIARIRTKSISIESRKLAETELQTNNHRVPELPLRTFSLLPAHCRADIAKKDLTGE